MSFSVAAWVDVARTQLLPVVKVDRRIRWHYTTTIAYTSPSHWCTRYRNCKFHNRCPAVAHLCVSWAPVVKCKKDFFLIPEINEVRPTFTPGCCWHGRATLHNSFCSICCAVLATFSLFTADDLSESHSLHLSVRGSEPPSNTMFLGSQETPPKQDLDPFSRFCRAPASAMTDRCRHTAPKKTSFAIVCRI